MISYKDFKQFDFHHVLSINEDMEVQEHTVGKIQYLTIDNFFKNPHDLVTYLKEYPVENYDDYILSTYKFGDKVDSEQPFLKPAGMQQLLNHRNFEYLAFNFYKVLIENNFVLDKGDSIYNDPKRMSNELRKFVFYTNIFYPGMFSLNNNHAPHFDQFEYAFNVYLSENVGGGTAFYSLNYKDKKYFSLEEIYPEDIDTRSEIAKTLNNYRKDDNIVTPYVSVDNDELFSLEHLVEYKFNRLVLYRGNLWHSAYYDSTTESNARYSIVGSYSKTADELN